MRLDAFGQTDSKESSMKFKLYVCFDEDGEPMSFFQEVGESIWAITSEVFDVLVGAPACASIETLCNEVD